MLSQADECSSDVKDRAQYKPQPLQSDAASVSNLTKQVLDDLELPGKAVVADTHQKGTNPLKEPQLSVIFSASSSMSKATSQQTIQSNKTSNTLEKESTSKASSAALSLPQFGGVQQIDTSSSAKTGA